MKHPLIPLAALLCTASLAAHAAADVTPASTATTAYAVVVSATPVMADVPVARRVCHDETRLVQPAPSGLGAVVGAIAGGVLGNSIGGGFGRAAATGLGVVVGASVGDQVEANNAPLSEQALRRCQVVNRIESRVVGYDVMYDFAGQRYGTRMARDPGPRLAIEVRPAASSTESMPVPLASANTRAQPVPVYAAPGAVVVAPPVIYVSPTVEYAPGYDGAYYGGYGGYYRGGYYYNDGYRSRGRWR